MKKSKFNVIVNVNLEYKVEANTEQEAIEFVENVELPKEYVEDSFDIVKVIDETAEENKDFKRCAD